ncbi:MAG TPA: cupredoxin domain-containing protein [Chthoniobacterales bacterium]|nr:cupredoxin domain-containing protein [Chthoniobacterales bacterium]
MKTLILVIAAVTFCTGISRAAEGQKINVTMSEYKFEMPSTVKAGKTTFVIKNAGKHAHSFAIKGEGINKKLATNPKPGQTQTLEVNLKPGTYVVTCPVDFHTAKGMKTTLTVK